MKCLIDMSRKYLVKFAAPRLSDRTNDSSDLGLSAAKFKEKEFQLAEVKTAATPLMMWPVKFKLIF